jgi:hypothetical protein
MNSRPKRPVFLARVERTTLQKGLGFVRTVYWCVRSSQKPTQKVLCWLGRDPDPAFVRAALQHYGLPLDAMSRHPKRRPAEVKRRRLMPTLGGSRGRQVHPRGPGPNSGMSGTVPSRFEKVSDDKK